MVTHSRRMLGDRRRRPTPPISRYFFVGGRRTSRRRLDDPPAYYVDRLGGLIWLTLLTIYLLQVLDAHLTIAHLRNGGVELNPIMNFLLSRSDLLFLSVKLAVAALGLLFLGIHKNFRTARAGLALIFVLFFGVVGWHFFLALPIG